MTEFGPHHADQIAQAHRRLDAHEGRLTKLETSSAVATERLENFQRSLDKIDSGIGWLIKLVIGGIVAGALAFMMGGGFNV